MNIPNRDPDFISGSYNFYWFEELIYSWYRQDTVALCVHDNSLMFVGHKIKPPSPVQEAYQAWLVNGVILHE